MSAITALHGFLGRPADWDFLQEAGFDVRAVDVFREKVPAEGDILLGYSLGGRLALQALIDGARYRQAVLVSTRITPAPPNRQELDEAWARRFEREEWSSLMRAWDGQPLFGGHSVERREEDFDRTALARALRDWSPAVLPPLGERLREINVPTLWIAGEDDTRYVAEAEHAAALAPGAEVWNCPGAGHRVPWQQPAAFVERLRAFAGVKRE